MKYIPNLKKQSCRNSNFLGLIFSKDRAMQLDATLSSLYLHCPDISIINLIVFYTASSDTHEQQYYQLAQCYKNVTFLKETVFYEQALFVINDYEYILFLVDDNIFVRSFSVQKIVSLLSISNDVIGFSLRLGTNTIYCYPFDHYQALPSFIDIGESFFKYDWRISQGDFGYPLEVSSSVYRTADLIPLFKQYVFKNPNDLEGFMHEKGRSFFFENKGYLICSKKSIVFSNPLNLVHVSNNKIDKTMGYTVEKLSQLFKQGYRINVNQYIEFIPNACHQNVTLFFNKKAVEIEAPTSVDL